MKITKRRLKQIIKEERKHVLDENIRTFNQNVRESLIHVLTVEEYALDAQSQENILQEFDLKKLASAASKGWDKAKETASNTKKAYADADVKALEKDVVAQGKKAGTIVGIGMKGIRAFMKPIAAQALSIAKELGLWSIKNVAPAIKHSIKFLGQGAKGAYGGISDVIANFKDAAEFKSLAANSPQKFKKMHSDYAAKFSNIGLPVRTADEAASYTGLKASDDGRDILEQAAEKAGVGIDVLIGQLNIFGYLAQYIDIAERSLAKTKATPKAARNEKAKLTESKLKQIIKEELQILGSLQVETNFVKKNKKDKKSWSDKYKALKAATIAKLEDEDTDVLEVLAYAIDSAEYWLSDEEDQQNFLWDVISAKPELGDPKEWIEDVFQKLRDDAYADHLSRLEDEATNPS